MPERVLHGAAASLPSGCSGSKPQGESQWLSPLVEVRRGRWCIKAGAERTCNSKVQCRFCSDWAPACYLETLSVPPFSVFGFVSQQASLKVIRSLPQKPGLQLLCSHPEGEKYVAELCADWASPWPSDWHLLISFGQQLSKPITWQKEEQVTLIGSGRSRHAPRALEKPIPTKPGCCTVREVARHGSEKVSLWPT